MLPLEILCPGRLHQMSVGTFAFPNDGSEDRYLVGTNGKDDFYIRFSEKGAFYDDLKEAHLGVTGITNVQFRGNQDTAISLEYADRKNGLLVIRKNSVFVSAAPFRGIGNALIKIADAPTDSNSSESIAFQNWQICFYENGRPTTLFEFDQTQFVKTN